MHRKPTEQELRIDRLYIWLKNDRGFHENILEPIVIQLAKRFKKGELTKESATTRMKLVVNQAAKDYMREEGKWGDPVWNEYFNSEVRNELAEELANEYIAEFELGNWVDKL